MKYYAYRLGQILARYVPRALAYWIGLRISDLYYFFDYRSRKGVLANLRHVFSYEGQVFSEHELRVLARETFHNFGKHVVEFFRFHRLEDARIKRLVSIPQLETLAQLLSRGRGVILFTAHLGSWELAGNVLTAYGYKLSAVALYQPGQKLNALFQRQRMARGLRIIPMGGAARPCLAALRQNELVVLLADRDFTANRTMIEFFGKPARLPRGPARLAQVSGAPLIPAFMVRNPDDTFRFLLGDPIWAKGRDEAALTEMLNSVVHQLEWCIRQYPTQWFLFNDLWNIEEDAAIVRRAFSASIQTLRESQLLSRRSRPSF